LAEKILVVDNDLNTLNAVKKMLEVKRYEVDAVTDAQKAWKKLRKNDYDLVLLDIMMDDITGEDALPYIRKYFPDTRVVIMSAIQPSEKAMKILESQGGDATNITKPFNRETLWSTVERALN